MTRIILAVSIACACLAPPAFSADKKDPESAFREDVMKLMEVTNTVQLTEQSALIGFDSVIQQRLKDDPDPLPPESVAMIRDVFKTELSKTIAAPGGLMERMAPIYMKYYTHDEVRELIRFYQSDLGSKVVAVTPFVLQESAMTSQTWFQEVLPQMLERIDERRNQGTDPRSGD